MLGYLLKTITKVVLSHTSDLDHFLQVHVHYSPKLAAMKLVSGHQQETVQPCVDLQRLRMDAINLMYSKRQCTHRKSSLIK